MNWVDWSILAIIGISSLLSLRRGFAREAISLCTWVAAFIVGRIFSVPLSTVVAQYVDTPPSVHLLIAFLILFIATLIVGHLIGLMIGALINVTGLSATDRVLGIGFGALRGGLVVVILLVLLGMTPAVQDQWWRESQLIPHFLVLETWSRDMAQDLGHMLWNIGS
ncbi:CvpA family protein [Nitrincola sp. MINF-07-Sa-05]|uniref:CvpA family protein n=1 Tax=Nitrincola salilacus TaxID=3400273 RepID=UPI003917ED7D